MVNNQMLELLFKGTSGKNAKISIPYPHANLSRQQAETAMTAIIDSDLFAKDGEDLHLVATGARYVTRNVEEIFSQA